jgi:hypothetical protein
MGRCVRQRRAKLTTAIAVFAWFALVGATLTVRPGFAQTYVSAEPIPSAQIVGQADLAKIEALDYSKRALWSLRLLYDCGIVQNVITTLLDNKAISTIRPGNTVFSVAAGGFEGVTNPSYVFKIEDTGALAASQSDIFVLDNALGYALNQGGTAQFSLSYDKSNPYMSPLDYAVITFAGSLTGEGAQKFFNSLGTINPALWSGKNAGFTQIALKDFNPSNSMLFLIGAVSKDEFATGLYKAAVTTPDATHSPLDNGTPTTATAGAAFPGNDWIASPNGEGYLSQLGNPSPKLLSELGALRQKHLRAVADLLHAMNSGDLESYLGDQFKCP